MILLKQKQAVTSREYRLLESKMMCKISSVTEEDEFAMPYENITGEILSCKTSNLALLIIAISVSIVMTVALIIEFKDGNNSLGSLYFLIIPILLIALYWLSREDKWKIILSDGNEIEIRKNIPQKETVNKFLDQLILKRNKYLKENFTFIDSNIDYASQFNNLKWLLSIEAISKAEFDIKYSELRKFVKAEAKSTGFSNNTF